MTKPSPAIVVNASAFIDFSSPTTTFFAHNDVQIMAIIAQGKEVEEAVEQAGAAPTIMVDEGNKQTFPMICLTFDNSEGVQVLIDMLQTLRSHLADGERVDA